MRLVHHMYVLFVKLEANYFNKLENQLMGSVNYPIHITVSVDPYETMNQSSYYWFNAFFCLI